MPRPSRDRHLAPALCLVVILMSLVTAIVACNGGGTTTTSAVAPGTTIAAEPTTTIPPAYATPESNALARELKRTVQLAAVLGQRLQDQGAAADDPRIAMVWALRARGQAVTARKAILEKQPELADNAVKGLRTQLARAGAMADGPLAEMIAKALALMATMGQPSSDPTTAVVALDGITKQLEPLIAQAQALIGSVSPATTMGG
jgi:hypothetical protein